MPVDALVDDIDSAAIVPGTADSGQNNPLPLKRQLQCSSEDSKPAAKRQRPVLMHRESTSSETSIYAHPEPVPEQPIPLSALALGSVINNGYLDQGSDVAACAPPTDDVDIVVQDSNTDQPPAHIELLEDYLAKLFQGEDQISDHNGATFEHFRQIASARGDVVVLNKCALQQLRLLLAPCSPELLARHVPDDEINRVVSMLVAVVEAADGAGLADIVKSGALVDGDTELSTGFRDKLDQMLSSASHGLDASSLIVDLAATGKASNSACPSDILHAVVTLFKDCVLGCVVPLLDMDTGCPLANAISNNDGFLCSRLLAFLGTVLVAHGPITALVSGPTLAEQDIISLVFAAISMTFCTSDLLGSGTGANILESIRRAAQSLL
ncbi:hypothetical protein FBU31_005204, partial [Coemansia sp. 'formosensis']